MALNNFVLRPIKVGFLYVEVEKSLVSLRILTSKKDKEEFVSVSKVKFIRSYLEFKQSKNNLI